MRRRAAAALLALLALFATAGKGCSINVTHHHSDHPGQCAADNPYCV